MKRSRHLERGHGSLRRHERLKTGCIKLYGLLVSLMGGGALQCVKAVEDSSGLDARRSLNKALEQTSRARGLALLGSYYMVSIFNE